MPDFEWTDQRVEAAELLAEGYLQKEVAEKIKVDPHTIYNWRQVIEFEDEVNRLTMMRGLAIRAERARQAKRAIRQMVNEETGQLETKKDVLDWLKYLQSETNGAIFSVPELAAFLENAAPVAGSGQAQSPEPDQPETGSGTSEGDHR